MRPDFYATIHKAIRRELCLAVIDAGTAVSPTDWRALAAKLRALGIVLEAHAGHEARFLHPRLAEIDGALARRLDDAHAALDASFGTALGAVDDAAARGERACRGAAYGATVGFAPAYPAHMLVEGREAMPAFWSQATDDELRSIHGRLIGSIPPDLMGSFLALMLPAVDHDERVELLGGVRASAPQPVFARVLALAEQLLPPPSFAAVRTALGAAS